jgi:hypothetical protein
MRRRRLWVLWGLVVAALFALPVHVEQAHADELIVDDTDPAVLVSGPWLSASATDGNVGSDYLYRTASGGGATVFWPFPSTLTPGRYEVFARWTSGPNRAADATYWVASDGVTQSVTENQQTNGSVWQSLGSFDFRSGKSQGVTLTDSPNGVVVADAVRWVGQTAVAGANRAPVAVSPTSPLAMPPSAEGAPTHLGAAWTVTLNAVDLYAGPAAATDKLASVPQFSYLQVLGYQGDWAYVYNPRARGTAYAPSNVLGPSDPPPAWITAEPPSPTASIERMGRTVGSAPVAFYPVDDKFAFTGKLGHNIPVLVHDRVQAADGSTWYRVDGGYVAASSVRLPRPPTRTFSGRWLDADLAEPAMLTAYQGDKVVLSTLAIKGTIANQTPTGTFSIQRRVQDETMDSGTLGVDPHGPGGYHLEHVLYTQYFTSDGASIHYNYWSSNFGYSGSHGCLGLDMDASQFLWNWADIGTPVVIRS